ncbi:MAG TPA: MaoC family dehydratase [Candidatus Nanoarchaeia archaeon]|nr:MaoC family dehydratase [Candidatus Nanoarchaeia archaeon]
MAIFEGLWQAISSIWPGTDQKEATESLENKINKVLAEERDKIRPSREDIDVFSWITKDNNPIHRLAKRAKKLGFDDTPIMGVHIAAYGEQFIEKAVEHMREFWGADIKIIGQHNTFKAPVYPGDRILWQITPSLRNIDEEIHLGITGTVKDKIVIEISSRLGKAYKTMPQIAGPVFSERHLLDADRLEAFYNCAGGKNNGKVSNMLPASYVPATLLKLLEQKTQTMEGTNLAMNFEFLREVEPGRLQVDIFPPRRARLMPPRKDAGGNVIIDPTTNEPVKNYLYKFNAVVSQETKPVTYGEIICATNIQLGF